MVASVLEITPIFSNFANAIGKGGTWLDEVQLG